MARATACIALLLLGASALGQAGCAADAHRTDAPRPADIPLPPAVPALDLALLERTTERLLNEARQAHRRKALAGVEALAALARRHSADMAARDFFDHVNLRGLRPKDRARAAGLRCNPGENLYQTYQYASYQTVYDGTRVEAHYAWKTERQIAEDAVAAWLESPAHRATLLNPAFTAHGVGASRAPGLMVYLTQNLC